MRTCYTKQFKVPKIKKKMSNIYEIDNDKVVGFENEAATIINQLIHGSKVKEVVLITGMGGLGKTTLAKRVYEEKSIVNHFDKHAWCTVSQEFDLEDLLNKIYNQVCGKETETGSIAEKLRKSLMGWRYLIVLDDIWRLKAWEELNRVFPSCDNGSRVVLTSRQESVVSDAKPICLPFFTVDESWELLQVKLFKGKECPKELENIGKQISKECGGLPLIISLVAGLLGGVEKCEQMWQEFLNTLRSQVAFRGGMQSNDVIELSYKHLSHHLKQCLLYFSAFKEDIIIEVSYLIELWISEGFIKITEEERVEDTAKHYLNHLVGSNLVMVSKRNYNGGILWCVVHDLVHDFCLAKAKEENFLHIIKMEDKVDPTLKCTPHRISFHRYSYDDKIPNELVPWNSPISTILGYPKIQTSKSSDVYNDSWVAKKFEHLTILNFEFISVDKSILFEMNSLIHLKYLALYLVGRGSVSPLSLKNLQHLITLKLSSEKNLHLPKYFVNMKSLRHMTICHYDCHSCPTEPTPAGGIETISGLEVLQSLDLETFLCIRRDEHLLRKLSHLKYLSCAVSSSYPFADEIDMLHHLEFLQLHDLRFPKDHENPHLLKDLKIRKFPPNIKEINLESITLSSSAMSIIAQLSNLEALILVGCKFEEEEWNVEEEILFCKLKYLELIKPGIRIWNISSAAESFPCLEQVILNACWKLQTVPYSLADILTLKLISVRGCTDTCELSVKKIEEDVKELGNDEQLKIILRMTSDSNVSLANMTGPMKRRHYRNWHQLIDWVQVENVTSFEATLHKILHKMLPKMLQVEDVTSLLQMLQVEDVTSDAWLHKITASDVLYALIRDALHAHVSAHISAQSGEHISTHISTQSGDKISITSMRRRKMKWWLQITTSSVKVTLMDALRMHIRAALRAHISTQSGDEICMASMRQRKMNRKMSTQSGDKICMASMRRRKKNRKMNYHGFNTRH